LDHDSRNLQPEVSRIFGKRVPPTIQTYNMDYSVSKVSESARRLSGGSEKWLYVDPGYPEISPPVEAIEKYICFLPKIHGYPHLP
jgi:hypothetical protein